MVLLIISVANLVQLEAAFAGSNQVGQSIVLYIKNSASVTGGVIKLSDIAEFEQDVTAGDELKNIVVADSPRVGYHRIVTTKSLMRVLRSKVGGSIKFILKGAESTKVGATGIPLIKTELIKIAAAELRSKLGDSYDSYELRLHGNYRDILVPVGELELRSRTIASNRARGRMVVRVDILVDEKKYRTVPVWFDVELYKKVLVTGKNYLKKSELDISELNMEIRNVTYLSGNAITTKPARGLLTTKNLKVGEVITTNNTRFAPPIAQNQYLNMKLNYAGVVITKRVLAKQEARIGDIITARGEKTTEIFDVVVTSRNEGEPVWCEIKSTPHCL